jgi:hypothetical protein
MKERDDRSRIDKIFFGSQGEAARERHFCLVRSICEGYSEKIRDGELQSNSDTDGARYKTFEI